MLEVGTGWVHWESLVVRLFYDVSVDMTDVWDNRLFSAFQVYARQLRPIVESGALVDGARARQACALLDRLDAAGSFAEAYAALDLRYLQDPAGSLAPFGDDTLQLVISADVLEHVQRQAAQPLIGQSYRLLRPGGYSMHLIDLEDHLSAFDRAASPKQHLAYSDGQWHLLFENQVQYINRLQRPEWLELFAACGFGLVREERRATDACPQRVQPRYESLDGDLGCTLLRLVHRKPLDDLVA